MSGYRFFRARVSRITDLTPSFRRFTLVGDQLAEFGDPGMDQRIKLILPTATASLDSMPTGEDWYAQWCALDSATRPIIRTYTTRHVRADRCEVDLDMVVHEVLGPASEWIATAVVGDEVLLLGPASNTDRLGVGFIPPEQVGRYLLVGDETAAPAISVILEQLPRSAEGVALLELPQLDDAAYLPTHPGFQVKALVRANEDARNRELVSAVAASTATLVRTGAGAAVAEIDLDRELLWEVPRTSQGRAPLRNAPLYAWLAGEASGIKQLRRHLVGEAGVDRRSVAFMGYWRRGRPEGN